MTSRTGAPPVVRIDPMRRRHLRQVLRIDADQDGDRWSPGLFLAELTRGDADRCYLVARHGTTVVGYAGMLFTGGDGHLTTIAVDRRHRRGGVGSRLLLALARRAELHGVEAMTLEVRAGNEGAIALYRRFGFAPAGVRSNYYADDGEDALIMWASDVDTPGYRRRLDAIEAELAPGAPRTPGAPGGDEPDARPRPRARDRGAS